MNSILITGVSAGIGQAVAQRFLQLGWHVFGSVRHLKDASIFSDKYPSQFTPLVFDLTDQAAIEAAKTIVTDKLQNTPLTVLINNAGVAVAGPLLHLPISEFVTQQDINVVGLLRVTQTFAPLLKGDTKAGIKPGRIINISSLSGLISRPFMGAYSASKHAVEAISDSLRRELMIYGIDVITIEPGTIKTLIWTKAKSEKPRFQDTDYAPMFKNLNNQLERMEAEAIAVEKVVKVIEKAILTSKPKTRYLIAARQWFIWFVITFLSDRAIDNLFYKRIKALAENKTVDYK